MQCYDKNFSFSDNCIQILIDNSILLNCSEKRFTYVYKKTNWCKTILKLILFIYNYHL
jgi:hypothetical protein